MTNTVNPPQTNQIQGDSKITFLIDDREISKVITFLNSILPHHQTNHHHRNSHDQNPTHNFWIYCSREDGYLKMRGSVGGDWRGWRSNSYERGKKRGRRVFCGSLQLPWLWLLSVSVLSTYSDYLYLLSDCIAILKSLNCVQPTFVLA